MYVTGEEPEQVWSTISRGVVKLHNIKPWDPVRFAQQQTKKYGPDGKPKIGY